MKRPNISKGVTSPQQTTPASSASAHQYSAMLRPVACVPGLIAALLSVESIGVAVWCVSNIARRAQRREGVVAEAGGTGNRLECNRRTPCNIVPTEEEMPVVGETRMALREGRLALIVSIQPP